MRVDGKRDLWWKNHQATVYRLHISFIHLTPSTKAILFTHSSITSRNDSECFTFSIWSILDCSSSALQFQMLDYYITNERGRALHNGATLLLHSSSAPTPLKSPLVTVCWICTKRKYWRGFQIHSVQENRSEYSQPFWILLKINSPKNFPPPPQLFA